MPTDDDTDPRAFRKATAAMERAEVAEREMTDAQLLAWARAMVAHPAGSAR